MVVPIEWGVCVPAVCTEQDVAFAFKEIIKGFQGMFNSSLYRHVPS